MAEPTKLLLLAGITATVAWGLFELQRDNHRLPSPMTQTRSPDGLDMAFAQPEQAKWQDHPAILERPLFFADRKLPHNAVEPVTPAAPQQAMSAPNFRLSAIVIESDQPVALVETQPGNQTQRLEQGESIAGWAVDRIDESGLAISRGSHQQRIELREFASPHSSRAQAGSPSRRTQSYATTPTPLALQRIPRQTAR